jgi:hypothetical protein
MHRAALAAGIARDAPVSSAMMPRVHAAGQHVAVVAVGGDDGVLRSLLRLDAGTTASCPI